MTLKETYFMFTQNTVLSGYDVDLFIRLYAFYFLFFVFTEHILKSPVSFSVES